MAGTSRIIPEVSVTTRLEKSPLNPSAIITIISASPSPEHIDTEVAPVSVVRSAGINSTLFTAILLDRSKHPTMSATFMPTSKPSKALAKAIFQIKHNPEPAPLKSIVSVLEIPSISPFSSVTNKE